MKNIHISTLIKKWGGIFAMAGLLLTGACSPGEKNETDYVNEIEAEENAVGQPDGEDHDATPADVETEQDTTSGSQSY